MTRINDNFNKLQAGYLFPEIGRRTRAFAEANPDAQLIRLGIGDVTLPLIGLAPSTWSKLVTSLDAVLHSAAVVDRFLPLSALRDSNVIASARLSALAGEAGAAFHLVSSSAALPPVGTAAGDRVQAWPERSGLWTAALEGCMHTKDVHGGSWEGYGQSKWLAEQLCEPACVSATAPSSLPFPLGLTAASFGTGTDSLAWPATLIWSRLSALRSWSTRCRSGYKRFRGYKSRQLPRESPTRSSAMMTAAGPG